MILKGTLLFLLISFSARAAEVIELPKEELAQESVLPVFDNVPMVKNRNIVTEGRFELGGFYGMALTEPIANVSKFAGALYYHLNEDHALGLLYIKNSTGQSDYAKQLNSGFKLDFSRAPHPEYATMLDYNYKMLYGKMSITKKMVLNLSLFATAAIGQIKYVHKSYPAAALGVGQKFYLGKQVAFRLDLRLYGHQAPIPFKTGSPGILETSAKPEYSDFQDRMAFTNNLEAGLSFLF